MQRLSSLSLTNLCRAETPAIFGPLESRTVPEIDMIENYLNDLVGRVDSNLRSITSVSFVKHVSVERIAVTQVSYANLPITILIIPCRQHSNNFWRDSFPLCTQT